MSDAHAVDRGSDAALAAALFAVDPAGLVGVVVRGGPGPVRDAWLQALREGLPQETPVGRLPTNTTDDRLLGGLDLPASLSAGRPVIERGLLAGHDRGVVIVPMAERMEPGVAARLAAVLDAGEVVMERDGLAARFPARLGLVLLDEGAEPEERAADALLERLALRVDLGGLRGLTPLDPETVQAARASLEQLPPASDDLVEGLCAAATAFGVESIRAPLLAVRVARAHAALRGAAEVSEDDAAAAARLVLTPRALTWPDDPQDADAQPEPPPPPPSGEDAPAEDPADLEPRETEGDRLVEAVQAALPDGLLDRIIVDNQRSGRIPRRGGAGAAAKAAQRGRPAGSRPGALRPGDRLNLPETLRAAAPWRRLRDPQGGERLPVRAEDFRIRRFVRRRESTTIVVVDASGSAAFQRLAEAKGAVELLLAKAYVSRARVALVAFRDKGAEVLLPPTRSLTRAKRSLADLPGGGGTPLAAGLDAGLELALAERAKDRTPLAVILTDGRANIARDGAPGRPAAEQDALVSAARWREAGVGCAYVDTSPRPQPGGDRFARAMGAVYAPLPYADAGVVSGLVDELRSTRRGG